MRKKHFRQLFVVAFALCSLAALCACKAEETITQNAKDNYIQTSSSVNAVKELFCKKTSIDGIQENYTMKTADGEVKNGILITSGVKNANLYYTRPVDLKESEGEIISFEIPYTNTYQTGKVEVQIVDIYDENNSITVSFGKYEYNEMWSVVSAKNSDFNSFAGFNTHGVVSSYVENMIFPHNNLIGKTDGSNYHYAFNLCYDPQENQVYLKLKDSDTRLVCDFDDSYFTKNSNAFEGFTADNIYINIKFTEVVKTGAVFVQSIGGQSLAGTPDYSLPCDNIKIEGISQNVFYDGAVGYKYTLPQPIETDFLMGEQKVDVRVKNVETDVEISLDAAYSFTPIQAGEYKAVYSAKDFYGNDVSKEIGFTVNAKPREIAIVFEEKTYEVGDTRLLPTVSVSGGSGETEYSVYYEYNGKTYKEIEEISFTSVDDLTVKVTATDSIGYKVEKEQKYAIVKKALCYLNTPLPKAARIGEKLTLPALFAYDYVNEMEMSKKLYVNGNLVENSDWTVQASDGDCLTVDYYANEGEGNEQKISSTITIFNQEQSYFLYDSETLNMQILEEYTTFKARNAVSKFSVSYPYALSCDLLNISLLLGEHSRYAYTDVKLIDYVDGTSVTYRLKYESGGLVIAVRDKDGEFTVESLATDYLESVGAVDVYYSNEECCLLNYRYNEIVKASYTDGGEMFNGFENGGVYVEFEAVSVKTDAELRIVKLSNQEFYIRRLSSGDTGAPELAFQGDLTFGEKALNETIVLPRVLGFDVLTGEVCPVEITVYSPSGVALNKVVFNEAQTLQLNEYGTWTFVFESADSNKRRAYKEETINVKDDVLPTITTPDLTVKEAKVGTTLIIPTVSATDNMTETEIVCYALVRDPNMQYVVVEDNKITLDKKGTWLVVYYARDAEGNISTKEFSVQVK